MISAIPQKPQPAVVKIFHFMREQGLALDDLIEIGGEDLKSSNPKRAEKARRVKECWSLMARLSVKFTDLEAASPPTPDKPSRRRRGEGHFSEVIETKEVLDIGPAGTKSNEINDLANSSPVGGSDLNPVKARIGDGS